MTNKAKSELFKMQTRAKFPFLVHIHNDDLGDYRYINSDTNETFEGKVYEAGYFYIDPAEQTESSIGNARLTISAVDRTWIEKIRTTQKRSTIRFIAAIVYTEDGTKKIEPIEDNAFELTSAQWNDDVITWTMIFDDKMNILIPCDTIGANTFPASV